MNKKLIFSGFILVALVLAMSALFVRPIQAASINNTGNLPAGQTVDDDLIIGAQTVQIDGTVNGNVVAMGSTVTVNGTINGDLITWAQAITLGPNAVVTGNVFSGGQDMNIQGTIGGSLFAGGEEVTLGAKSSVNRNVYFGGYSLTTQNGSTIGKDLRGGLYQAILNGKISQDAVLSAGAVELTGEVGHNVELWLSDSSKNKTSEYMPKTTTPAIQPGLHVDPNAQISGKFIYTSPQKYDIQAIPGGGIEYHTPSVTETTKPTFGPALVSHESGNIFKTWHALSSLITLLLVGALLVGVFPNPFGKTVETAQKRTLASAGVGLLVLALAIPAFLLVALVIVAAGILLSFISLGGLTYPVFGLGFGVLGLAATALVVLAGTISKVIFAFLIGELILKAFQAKLSVGWQKALPLLIGVIVYAVLASVPYIGWLVALLATIIGIGAVWFWLFPGKPTDIAQPELPLNQ
jgi:cytoskeletal protein CcmA (bactofilin family)